MSWLVCFSKHSDAQFKLFCLPYAGGGASVFRRWATAVGPSVEVYGIQLPGRETRIAEAPLTNLLQVSDLIVAAMLPSIDKPYAIFGHSLGGRIAFELARSLRAQGVNEPAYLFVSGCPAPHLPPINPPLYNLATPDLLSELRGLRGTPEEVLANPELMALLLPRLRADFQMLETYLYSPAPPLTCPISAFGGTNDLSISRHMLDSWRIHTTSTFDLHFFPGGHFFIHDHYNSIVTVVAHQLLGVPHPDIGLDAPFL